MPIASFQQKVFQVSSDRQYTLDGLAWNGALETESQEKVKDKPSTYIKGFGLGTLSFEIQLRADSKINVRAEIEQWEAIRDKANPDLFILGSKPIGRNKWLLKSLGVSNTEIDGRGRLLKATLKIDLEEYVRAGKATPKTKTTAGTGSTQVPGSYVNPPEKPEEKRDNPNAAVAAARISHFERLYGNGV